MLCAQNTKYITASYFGIFDDSYDHTMIANKSIPWTMFDRIYIAFTFIDEYGNLTNSQKIDDIKIHNVVKLYKKSNPNGEIFISTGYGGVMDDRYEYASNHSIYFANSVLKYLIKYNLDGIDLDWETLFINIRIYNLITLIKACKHVFNNKYKITHTVWPMVHSPYTVGLLSPIVDQINIMSYNINLQFLEPMLNTYNNNFFPYHKMILGIETESGEESKDTIQGKVNLIKKYNLGGIFIWRLDNDGNKVVNNTVVGPSIYNVTKILYNLVH